MKKEKMKKMENEKMKEQKTTEGNPSLLSAIAGVTVLEIFDGSSCYTRIGFMQSSRTTALGIKLNSSVFSFISTSMPFQWHDS